MKNKYSLTFPQKNIWLVEKFFGKSPINTIVGIFNINKEFDVEICKKAINKMVELNDGLRLKVLKEQDSEYQYVEEYNYFDIDYFDISGENDENRKKLENKLVMQPFDVIENPLYYFAIVRLGKDNGYIFVKLHHLVSDAWTFGNVATELGMYIDMFTTCDNNFREKPSYIDFIESEKEYIASEKFSKDKEFWQDYLLGLEESVGLKENSDKTSIDAKRYTVKLDKKLNEEIKNFCKENRVSPYTLFINALAIYIHRVTEKYDFVIGTPVLNRANFKEKKMMGMFVSTMPVRFKIDEKETFLDMCKKSASETMTLFRHQKYPYSMMLQDFREKNNVSSNLYEVMVSYQNARAEYSDNEKYTTDWLFSTKVQDQFAIHIMDMDETGILELHFDYLTDLFEDVEIEYISKRLFTIIQDGIENNKTIETIEIMPEEEKNKILYEFNDTKRDYPKDKTVIDLFEEQVEKTPDNIALVFEGKKLTYKELNEKANSLAWYLKDKGVKENDRVAITLDKSINLMVAILATLKVGACYVPIDTSYGVDKKEYIIKDAECNINIVEDTEDFELSHKTINMSSCSIYCNSNKNIIREKTYTWDSLAYVMYTSGTTGKPKGAMITNRNIVRLVKNTNYIYFKEDDRIIQTGATVFDACTFEYWGALLNGLTLCMIPKLELLDPFMLENFITKNNITIMWLTAPLFNNMVELNINIFKNIRVLLTGGDVLSVKHINMVRNKYRNITIVNGYGPTENTTFSNCFVIDKEYTKRIPIGGPIANSTSYVVDSKNRIMPIFVKGELLAGGDGVSKGYINNNKLTSEKYLTNIFNEKRVYKTGDIVAWSNNGVIDFYGRRDNQVKIRGYRVELDEIKNCMQNYNKVKEAFIDIRVYDSNQKELFAYFVSEVDEDTEMLKKYLREKLPIYMIPKEIIQLDKIPLTVNGKIDRTELLKVKNRIEYYKENNTFSDEELELKEYIAKQLSINVEYPNTNLIDVGMDSLNAIKLAIKLSEKYKVDIKTSEIFENLSIRDLIELISTKNKVSTNKKQYNNNKVELTVGQKGILGAYLINNENIKYNVPFEMVVSKIDVQKLRKAIINVINKNEILYMNVVIDENNVYGKINKRNFDIKINECNLEEYKNYKNKFIKPMNLEKDLLFNIEIYCVKEEVYVLFDFNHIVFDGYSLKVFLDELICEYENKSYVTQPFINIGEINNEKYLKEKNIYMEMFKNPFEETTIRKNNYVVSDKGLNSIFYLDENVYSRIKEKSRDLKTTANNLMNSAFVIALAKITNNLDITIGVATSGRNDNSKLYSIGMYVNTLPIKYEIQDLLITDFVKYCNRHLLKLMDCTNYTYPDLINDLHLERKKGINPIFNIVYSYQFKDNDKLIIDKRPININQIYTNTSKFELAFQVIDDGLNPMIVMEYNPDMVDKDIISKLKEQYINVLNFILDNSNKSVGNIIKISDLSKNQIKIKSENINVQSLKIFENEKKITDIFGKVLGKKVNIDDDFFTSGGDSLIAIKLVSELISCGYHIKYADVFEFPSPRKMSSKIFENSKSKRIDEDIEKYDYSKINRLLDLQKESFVENRDIGNILLTGATGFLGAHILDEFLSNQKGTAFCLVREANGIRPEKRLKDKLEFFFGNKYKKEFGKRIIVVEGDILLDDIFLKRDITNDIMSQINIIINSAAYVKHYGNKELFYKINVNGVNNLINFSLKYNKKLIQVSTLSVSGNLIESGQLEQKIKKGTHFTEKDLYIQQNLNNIYAYTKFLAERLILENIISNGLDAKIIRMGNLTGRKLDGKFQPNVEDNAFANRIKSLLSIGKIPNNLRDLYLEFTPIDLAARCVVNICKDSKDMIIYHIFNHEHMMLNKAYELFRKMGYDIVWVSKEEMHITIENLLKDENSRESIEGIIQDLNSDSDLEYSSNTIIDSNISCNELLKYNFKWKKVNEKYFYNYINYLIKVGFLEGDIYDD